MREKIFIGLTVIGILLGGFLIYKVLTDTVEESRELTRLENQKAFTIDSLQKACIYKDAQIKSLEWVLDQTREIKK